MRPLIAGNVTGCSLQLRYISYEQSPSIDTINYDSLPEVEIIKNAPEWKFVQLLLRKPTIATPTIKPEYPSGWKPQTIDPSKAKYYIRRSKNHQLPIHLFIQQRGMRRITQIKRVSGDIYAMGEELRLFLEDYTGRKHAMRINEYSGTIFIKGDYVNLIKPYLMDKGF